MKQEDVSRILVANPQIAQDKLEEHRAMLAKLRAHGTRRSEYRLAPPYGGRHASVQGGFPSRHSHPVLLKRSSERAGEVG